MGQALDLVRLPIHSVRPARIVFEIAPGHVVESAGFIEFAFGKPGLRHMIVTSRS
jgi:hypothetical protein